MTRFRRADDIGVVDDGDRVFAATLPRGPIVVLAGIAVDVWRAAPGVDLPEVAARLVSDGVCETAAEAEADAAMYARALTGFGLLIEEKDS